MSSDLRELERLERTFFRAPSAHNTQPWVLEYEAARVMLRFDPARVLAVGDPTRRDLLLSLGAFVEAVLVVASEAGIAVAFEPDVDLTREQVGAFVPADAVYETAFSAEDVERRRTSRLRYEPGRVREEDLAAVRAVLGPGTSVHELPTREVVDLYALGDRRMYDSPAAVEELRSWLRLSPRDPRYAQDGLSYECLDLSRAAAALLALALRPLVYRLVRALRAHRLITVASKAVLARDGSVLVLAGGASGPEAVLEQGRSLLRVWLALSRRGLYTHPLSQMLDDDTSAQLLAERVGAAPFSVFRVGPSAVPPRSARLR